MSCFSTTSIFYIFFFFPLLLRHQRKDQFLCCFSPMGPLARRSRGSTLGGWRRGSRAGRRGRSCHLPRVAHVTLTSFSSKEWVVFAGHIGAPWFRLICLFSGFIGNFFLFYHFFTQFNGGYHSVCETIRYWCHLGGAWFYGLDEQYGPGEPHVKPLYFAKLAPLREAPLRGFFMLLLSISFTGTTMTISTFFEFGLEEKLSNKLYLYNLCTGKDLISTFYHPLYFEF